MKIGTSLFLPCPSNFMELCSLKLWIFQIMAVLSQLPLNSTPFSLPAANALTNREWKNDDKKLYKRAYKLRMQIFQISGRPVDVWLFRIVNGSIFPAIYMQIVASLLPVHIHSPPSRTQTELTKFVWFARVKRSAYAILLKWVRYCIEFLTFVSIFLTHYIPTVLWFYLVNRRQYTFLPLQPLAHLTSGPQAPHSVCNHSNSFCRQFYTDFFSKRGSFWKV